MAFTGLGIVGGIIATKLIEPDYEVSATIWIETPNQGRAGTPIQGEELLDSQAWVELLQTFKVLDPVVRSRKLYLSHSRAAAPLFADFDIRYPLGTGRFEIAFSENGKTYSLKQKSGLFAENGNVGDSVGLKMGWRWVPRGDDP